MEMWVLGKVGRSFPYGHQPQAPVRGTSAAALISVRPGLGYGKAAGLHRRHRPFPGAAAAENRNRGPSAHARTARTAPARSAPPPVQPSARPGRSQRALAGRAVTSPSRPLPDPNERERAARVAPTPPLPLHRPAAGPIRALAAPRPRPRSVTSRNRPRWQSGPTNQRPRARPPRPRSRVSAPPPLRAPPLAKRRRWRRSPVLSVRAAAPPGARRHGVCCGGSRVQHPPRHRLLQGGHGQSGGREGVTSADTGPAGARHPRDAEPGRPRRHRPPARLAGAGRSPGAPVRVPGLTRAVRGNGAGPAGAAPFAPGSPEPLPAGCRALRSRGAAAGPEKKVKAGGVGAAIPSPLGVGGGHGGHAGGGGRPAPAPCGPAGLPGPPPAGVAAAGHSLPPPPASRPSRSAPLAPVAACGCAPGGDAARSGSRLA